MRELGDISRELYTRVRRLQGDGMVPSAAAQLGTHLFACSLDAAHGTGLCRRVEGDGTGSRDRLAFACASPQTVWTVRPCGHEVNAAGKEDGGREEEEGRNSTHGMCFLSNPAPPQSCKRLSPGECRGREQEGRRGMVVVESKKGDG